MVVCRECGVELLERKRKSNICDPCRKEYHRSYYRANKDRMNAAGKVWLQAKLKDPEWKAKERERGRKYWQEAKRQAMQAYGNKCACCGESDLRFLSIDHVNNDGAAHRRELLGPDRKKRGAGSAIYNWLRKNDYPEGFQVLCFNCNMGKQINGGICPHKDASPPEHPVNSVKLQTGQYRAKPAETLEGVTIIPQGSTAKWREKQGAFQGQDMI